MLQGLKVLDLTFYLPGPYATLFLADLGAEVIKIENPAGGDPLRGLGPEGASPAGLSLPAGATTSPGSVLFQAVNRNKKSLTLDLKAPEGRDLFLRLAAAADAVIEQFRPGVATRLGIDYEVVRSVNPRIVYVSLTGYGQTGPNAGEAGHDLNYLARAGLLSLFLGTKCPAVNSATSTAGSGAATAPPLPPIQIADLNGGSLSAIALLAGMLGARLRGKGAHLDVSMTDGVFALLSMTAANYLAAGGQPPYRSGPSTTGTGGPDTNLFLAGNEPFYNVYAAADGRLLAVGALEPKFWLSLCALLAANDPERKDASVIAGSREEAARVFATKPAAEWLQLLEGKDVCVAPVLSVEEALASNLARARGVVVEAGTHQIGPPVKLAAGGKRGTVHRRAPRLGEHNHEILSALGLGEAELTGLAARGVISGP